MRVYNMESITIIINTLAHGGAERVTITLAEWFSNKKYNVNIITFDRAEKEYNLDPSVKRISLDKYQGKIKKIFKLRNLLKSSDSDIVLVMGVPLLIYFFPAIVGLGIPYVVSERNDPNYFDGKKLTKYISRLFLQFSDGVVFQTKQAKEFYSKRIQKKSTIIPNPLMSENLPAPYMGEREKKIVSVGRLVKQKNHILLIRAFKTISESHPEYKLEIYGEGPERANLENEIEKLGLKDKVTLPGVHDDVLEKIKTASIFVLSSNFEGIPNALIEAMAIGLPCISTDTPSGGPSSLIENYESGILVRVKDLNALEREMINLIESKDLSNKLCTNAVKVRERLKIDRISYLWLDFLKLSLDKKNRNHGY